MAAPIPWCIMGQWSTLAFVSLSLCVFQLALGVFECLSPTSDMLRSEWILYAVQVRSHVQPTNVALLWTAAENKQH